MRTVPRASPRLALAFTAAAVCFALRSLLSFDQVPVFRDLLLFIVPIKYFLGEHLRRGEIPFWNPWICLGSPFVAAMHTGVFYPPSALLLLPLPLGFNLFLLAHYLIALLGMWRFLTVGRGLRWPSAALGSLTFAVGGYMISLLNIPKELHGAAWLPWALLFWTRWLREGSGRDFALTAVVVSLAILGGSVESALMIVALLAAFALRADHGSRLRAAAGLLGAVAVASALTAFQLLPTLEYALQSGRGTGLAADQVFHWSLQPVSLLQLAVPISAGGNVPGLGIGLERDPPMLESLYLGVPALCLAFAGVVGGHDRRFWTLVLLVAFVTALGSSTPLLPLLYRGAPALFGRIRYPEKFLLLFHVSAAVLAAEGLSAVEAGRRAAWLAAVIIGAALCVIGTGFWWLVHHDPRAYLAGLSWIGGRSPTAILPVAEALESSIARLAMLAASVVGVLVLARRALLRTSLACIALVVLQAADLVGIRWRTLATTSWREIEATTPQVSVDELRERGQSVFHYSDVPAEGSNPSRFRLAEWPMATSDWISEYRVLWGALFGNVSMVYGVGNAGGADGFQRRDMKTFLDVLPTLSLDGVARLLGGLGVAYLVGPSARTSPLLELVQAGHGAFPFVYRVRDALPFAHLAARLHVEKSEAEALAWLAREDFDVRREAVVESLPEGWAAASPLSEAEGTVEVTARKDELIELRVVTESERLLVVNDAAYPGWKATVDGQSTEIVRTNGLVRGVRIPPGDHRVAFRFRPTGFFGGCALAATLVLGSLAFYASRAFARGFPEREETGAPDR